MTARLFYSILAGGDDLFDIYDDDQKVVGKLTFNDFAEAWAEQKKA